MSPGQTPRPLLVIGLDGATFDVIDPLVRAGRLPNLARMMQAGEHAPLPSTVPPMTFPAWSTFLTGLGPGRHGVFDFTQKVPGAYRIRFTNASDRRGASIFARVTQAGGRVLALGMPATFPPEPVDGLLVCGFDAPVSSGTDAAQASDPALYRAVAEAAGPWMRPDLRESAEAEAFHERAMETLLARVERKTRFAEEALRRLRASGRDPSLVCIVFSESDTAAHHYWRDHDPGSPRHDPGASAARKDALAAVYERLDDACGELREAFGEHHPCALVSDHGFGGAGVHVAHLGRYLADQDLLVRRPGSPVGGAARGLRDLALRVLPPGLAQTVFRRARPAAARLESAVRFGGTDWSRTLAFSEEANTQPGVWINRASREAEGCVADADYERVRTRVIDALEAWKLPCGRPVVARARPREDVYEGPFVSNAPDIVVELALTDGYGLSLVPTRWDEGPAASISTLEPGAYGGGRGRGMNGTHRSEGIWIAHGEGAPRLAAGAGLVDVAPALLAAMGIEPRDGPDPAAPAPTDYTAEEEARVAARLKALGYLE